ncbi:MAG: hypothetical protein K2Q21_07960 [Chitinophagaceae bacterium]|nr:hypothetical protein [Chitinophagaceae bacterium]
MKKLVMIAAILTINHISCTKDIEVAPTEFTGTWTINQVYGNDYWGGPAYWKNADSNTKLKFTTDGKYFRKYPTDSAYTLIGSYLVLSNSKIKISQINPPVPSYPTYTLDYSFDIGGFMTWGVFGTEGIIKEKFKINP